MKNRTRLIRKITNLLGIGFIMFGVIPVSVFSQVGSVYAAEQAEDGAAAIVLPAFTSYAGLLDSTSDDPPADAPPAEEPADEAPADAPPAEEPADAPPAEEPADAPLAEEPADAPLAEEPADAPLAEEPADAPPADEAPFAEESPAEESPAEETSAEENLSEIVEAIAETGVVLVNEDEEIVSLATEEAADLISAGDPWFIRNNGTVDQKICYVPTAGCAAACAANSCDVCNCSPAPMQDAIDDVDANGMPNDGTINVEAGTYAGFDISGFSSDLVIQGAGIGTTIFNSQIYLTGNSANITLRNFTAHGADAGKKTNGSDGDWWNNTPTILALSNSGTLTLEHLVVDHNNDTAIFINNHSGDVVMDDVSADGKRNDRGTYINNTAGSGNVEVTDSTFHSKRNDGLYVKSKGYVLLDGVTSSGSGDYGAYIKNIYGTKNVAVLNSTFNNNGYGLKIYSKGWIVLDNVTANDNNHRGVYLETSGSKVVVKNSHFLDTPSGGTQDYGLEIKNTGDHVTSICDVEIETHNHNNELVLRSPTCRHGSYVYNICRFKTTDTTNHEIYVYGGTRRTNVIVNFWPFAGLNNYDICRHGHINVINQTTGNCGDNCATPSCGDGTVQEWMGEECDDGNTGSGDGCSANCTWEAVNCVGDWGPCGEGTGLCGAGNGSQTYIIETPAGHGGDPCPYADGAKQTCDLDPCVNCVGDWGPCGEGTGLCGAGNGSQTYIIETPAGPGGDPCPYADGAKQTCDLDPCVNCVGDWGPCGEGTGLCGAGNGSQTYIIETPAGPGGDPCPYADGAKQTCDLDPCVNCVGAWGDCEGPCGTTGTKTYVITTPAGPGGVACAYAHGSKLACQTGACPMTVPIPAAAPVVPAAAPVTAAAVAVPPPVFIIPVTGGPDLITAGIGHTCALTTKDGLECWGLNEAGQVGDGSFVDKLKPVDVAGIDPNTVIGLVSGIHHTCVLTSANEVYCWGLNSSGQLGDDTTENSNMPVLVDGLEGTVISISAGAEFTCALNSANEVFCWGNNSSGQLNDGTEEHSSIPVKTTTISDDAVLISGGSSELQGITSDGAVQLWNSQPIIPVTGLPDEDNTFVSADRFTEGGCSMTNVGDVNCWGGITDAEVIGALVSDMLASGGGHACTMKSEGLVCWGSNSNGQLGDDSTDDSTDEVLVTGLEQGVIALAAGENHTCVIYEDETVACWGHNVSGQLGNSTTDDSKVPVDTK